jgi:hypothetical protein
MADAATARLHPRPALGSPGHIAPQGSEHYPVIDVLRGVSILLVILLHVQLRFSLEPDAATGALPHALWRLLCRNGNEGVRIFFVISGFLITSSALQRWGALHGIRARRFYGLRLARIAPTLAVLLVVLSALHLVGAHGYIIDPRVGLGRALVAAATFHVNWLEASRNLYLPPSWDVLWSLAIEQVFYLFFPLVCLLNRWPLGGHALLTSLVVAGAFVRCALVDQPMWQSKSYFACMDGIALGCRGSDARLVRGGQRSEPSPRGSRNSSSNRHSRSERGPRPRVGRDRPASNRITRPDATSGAQCGSMISSARLTNLTRRSGVNGLARSMWPSSLLPLWLSSE